MVRVAQSAHRTVLVLGSHASARPGGPRAALRDARAAAGYKRPVRAASRSAGTLVTASRKIVRLIFE